MPRRPPKSENPRRTVRKKINSSIRATNNQITNKTPGVIAKKLKDAVNLRTISKKDALKIVEPECKKRGFKPSTIKRIKLYIKKNC